MGTYELHRDGFTISTARSRLDADAIVSLLARAYWARGRTREVILRSLANSLCFGVYEGRRQIGLARVISDQATFAYLCDVVVDEQYRGRGLGKWLIGAVMAHPDLQGLKRWSLATRDAHGLYRQFGWTELTSPERWMQIVTPPAPPGDRPGSSGERIDAGRGS